MDQDFCKTDGIEAVYTTQFYNLKVSTGDVLCTRDGEEDSIFGHFWKMLGRLVPGEVDHCLVYLGPGGRCVESGPKGVIVFDMPEKMWDAGPLWEQRLILDTLYGAAYPLANRGLSAANETLIRTGVAAYCLEQAAHCKPYNINFFDPQNDGAFYCSQLVYKAYLDKGIDLLSSLKEFFHPSASIVFPQDILNACFHLRYSDVADVFLPDR